MKNISKMDRNGNEIDKALDEALNVLHRRSELAEDELRDRMKDDVWRELCADLAECERVVTEDECRANHDVDKLWNQFKEQMEKGEQKRYHHIFLWVVGCTGLVASICLIFFLLGQTYWQSKDNDLFFAAVPQSDEVTFQVKGESAMTLEEAVANRRIEKTEQGWKLTDEDNADAGKVYDGKQTVHTKEAESVQTEWQCISVPRGKDFTFVLADGTKVWLNAETTLEYPTHFVGHERNVRLMGEAYFDVTSDKDHPFIVETDNVKTRVLGTEFNVRKYSQEAMDITLVDGSVEVVTDLSLKPIAIRPNENLCLRSNGAYELRLVDVSTYISWKEGLFYFDDVTLDQIIYELGRWYNVNFRIANENLLNYKLHFYCNRKKNIKEAIRLLENLGHFNIRYENNTVTIQQKELQ